MKLSTSRDRLLGRLQVAGRAVSTRSAIPALSGIKIEATGTGTRLHATDMEVGLQVELGDGPAEQEGTVVLPGRLLVDVVRSLPDESVSLEFRPEQRDVEIVSGQARFHIKALAADEFPKLPALDGETAVEMAAESLVQTIDRVARSASRDEARPILTGVLVIAEGSSLTMVATDSYRLSVKQTELKQSMAERLEANVPARALQELSRIVAGDEVEAVRISVSQNQVVFGAGDVVLSSRLIDGQFPNYRQLLPAECEHEVRLNRSELLDVVRRVGLLALKNAPLRLAFAEGELTVSAVTPDVGEASESLPANFSGERLEIGFNPEFMRDGIESVESEELVLRLITPLRPGLLRPVEGDDYQYLIMPIRLNA